MADAILYFFRQKTLLFYSGLLSLSFVYSYFLALYFLELSSFQTDIYNLLLFFSFVWVVLFSISFSKNKQKYAYERETEKYKLLRHQITQEYKLDIKDNIFSKMDLITSFMKEHFSTKGLLSIRILKLTNNSLALYIENLKIQNQLQKAYAVSSAIDKKEFYKDELLKNEKQNSAIEEYLDNFIQELMSKNNNDSKIDSILDEFEHSTKILIKIKPR